MIRQTSKRGDEVKSHSSRIELILWATAHPSLLLPHFPTKLSCEKERKKTPFSSCQTYSPNQTSSYALDRAPIPFSDADRSIVYQHLYRYISVPPEGHLLPILIKLERLQRFVYVGLEKV